MIGYSHKEKTLNRGFYDRMFGLQKEITIDVRVKEELG
jgi:hypothetical protein